MTNINMLKHQLEYQILAVFSFAQVINAASIQLTTALPSITSTSGKPFTLLLPPGFDSQLPPRQPMLYPFVVSTTTPSTPSLVIKKSLGPFVTPGWIPISSSSNINNYKDLYTHSHSTPTTKSTTTIQTPQPHPVPLLEDRVSKYILKSNDNGPVFESIIYGTWKPDPPLQPVEILNTTTTTSAKYNTNNMSTSSSNIFARTSSSTTSITVTGISDSNSGHASTVMDGKVSNKTINRQHGGFIDNKQQKIKTFENQSHPRDSHDSAVFAQSPIESTTLNNGTKSKQRKFVKKQGRQKIRPNSTTQTTKTTFEMMTTPIATTEHSATTSDAAKLDATIHPVEVVRQINDSIEVKYNHKQSSRHSIEVTAHELYKNHRLDDRYDELNETDDIDIVTAPTATSADVQQQQTVDADDDQFDDGDEGGSSVIRMNWPTDFMNTPSVSSTSTERTSEVAEVDSQATTSPTVEIASGDITVALSSLNIPPSLWPRFPGNITKLGSPYATESSLEEPALCVPITVREHNMMNSHETVNIERVFCFPMPSTKIPRGFSKPTSSSVLKNSTSRRRGTSSPSINANNQNFDDFNELSSRNASKRTTQSHLVLVCYVIAMILNFSY